MKIRFVILSAIVLTYLVEDGTCGVISDVYGNIHNRTVAVKDGVFGWLSRGKDWVLGSEKKETPQGRNGSEVVVHDSLYNQIYNGLLNRFRSARDKLNGFFVRDENDNKGFISSMYDKVKNRITRITAYIVGDDDEIEKPKQDDLSEIRRALNTMINHHKNNYEGQVTVDEINNSIKEIRKPGEAILNSVHSASETFNNEMGDVEQINLRSHDAVDIVKDDVNKIKKEINDHASDGFKLINEGVNIGKDKIANVDKQIQDTVDAVKANVNNMKNQAGEHVSNSVNTVSEISKAITDGGESLSSSLDTWKNSGVEISEKEIELLNAISTRIRNRFSKVHNDIENQKLSR